MRHSAEAGKCVLGQYLKKANPWLMKSASPPELWREMQTTLPMEQEAMNGSVEGPTHVIQTHEMGVGNWISS